MKLNVIFHEEAISDLNEIWLYTLETWSAEQADRYYELIIKEISFIAKHPESGKPLHKLREDYFSVKVNAHFVFYKFSSTELEVIRVLHESMDIPNRL